MVTRAPSHSGPPPGLPSRPPLTLTCGRGPRWRCWGSPVYCRVAVRRLAILACHPGHFSRLLALVGLDGGTGVA
eukprot:5158996-Pyramimonas_sp.AAC.1